MKRRLFFILIMMFFVLRTNAQVKRIAISTNLANLAVRGPSLAISYQASPRLGFQVYGSTGNFNHLRTFSADYKFKTAILDVKYTFFDTFYIGPYVRYIEKRVKREGYTPSTGFFGVHSRDFYGKGLSSGLLAGVGLAGF